MGDKEFSDFSLFLIDHIVHFLFPLSWPLPYMAVSGQQKYVKL